MSYTVQHEVRNRDGWDKITRPVPWWLVILTALVALTAIACIAAYIAHRMGYSITNRQDNIVVVEKTCPAPERPVVRWQCDSVERREYLNVCLKRKAT